MSLQKTKYLLFQLTTGHWQRTRSVNSVCMQQHNRKVKYSKYFGFIMCFGAYMNSGQDYLRSILLYGTYKLIPECSNVFTICCLFIICDILYRYSIKKKPICALIKDFLPIFASFFLFQKSLNFVWYENVRCVYPII